MGGITAKRCKGLVSIPKADGLKPRINGALRRVGGENIAATGAATAKRNFPIRQNIPAIGSNILDLCLSKPDVRDGFCLFQRCAHGGGNAPNSLLVKGQVTDAALQPAALKDTLCLKVGHGRIMLVNGAYQHAFTCGARSFGQCLAPAIKGGITNLTPIHTYKHHRLVSAT